MRIVLYHHDQTIAQQIIHYVSEYFNKRKSEYYIQTEYERECVEKVIEKESKYFDLFLIDFFDFKTGFALAAKLRSHNMEASWAMIGGSTEELKKAMIFRPSAYLINNDENEYLVELDRLYRYNIIIKNSFLFSFKFQGKLYTIPYDKICYFQSDAKRIIVRLRQTDQRFDFVGQLDAISNKIPNYYIRCHQSFIVNLKQIHCLDKSTRMLITNKGDEIPISRRYYNDVKEALERFNK